MVRLPRAATWNREGFGGVTPSKGLSSIAFVTDDRRRKISDDVFVFGEKRLRKKCCSTDTFVSRLLVSTLPKQEETEDVL